MLQHSALALTLTARARAFMYKAKLSLYLTEHNAMTTYGGVDV
jgi:hypothetical protein